MESVVGVEALGTLGLSEVAESFRSFLRAKTREALISIMAEEVSILCGPKSKPTEGCQYRAGSAPGYVLLKGEREDIVRPRVRRRLKNGNSQEEPLVSYAAAQECSELEEQLLTSMLVGVSGREQKRLHRPGTPKVSKSEVSRLWAREGGRILDEFRRRDLAKVDWAVLMMDGIRLGGDVLAVVALGITKDGQKILLDFEIGASETTEVCMSLVRRLKARGFGPIKGHRLYAVLDGAEALKKAILAGFPNTEIQRCLVHKERNLQGYLSKKHWGELSRLFSRLRKAEGEDAGREALAEIRSFVASKNAAAAASLEEAGDDIIRLQLLNAPSTLHKSLLSTNIIENPFNNVRRKLGRVSRWRAETDQPSRWLAYALTEAERGFRRIQGHKDLAKLLDALKLPSERQGVIGRVAAGVPLRATPSAPPQQRPLTAEANGVS